MIIPSHKCLFTFQDNFCYASLFHRTIVITCITPGLVSSQEWTRRQPIVTIFSQNGLEAVLHLGGFAGQPPFHHI